MEPNYTYNEYICILMLNTEKSLFSAHKYIRDIKLPMFRIFTFYGFEQFLKEEIRECGELKQKTIWFETNWLYSSEKFQLKFVYVCELSRRRMCESVFCPFDVVEAPHPLSLVPSLTQLVYSLVVVASLHS
ncbi:hypothetical protein GYH30_042077 [Glycine max]|uniref:Uncharacterized protein n=1 Tax=Glycine max TaxID=3847 RepID=A0A0R0G8A2_SOYBN|nr:hypothetical protein GYH30_042077 [Glycine max]